VIYGYLDAPILKQKDATFEVTLRSQTPNLSNSRTFKLSCNSEYGDESCGGSLIPATGVCLSNSTRNIIYSPAFTSDATTWKDGIITIGYESRQVIMHGDNCVEVRYPFSFDTVGHSFVINPGCDKSYARCSQWKNTGSYSGFLSIPRELVIRSS
jgi:hypothetical protein